MLHRSSWKKRILQTCKCAKK